MSASASLLAHEAEAVELGEDGIRLIPFAKSHRWPATFMTLKEYPVIENVLAATTTIGIQDIYGVVAVDDAEDTLAGYYVGKTIFPKNTVGLGCLKVANMAQICVSSRYQNRRLATRMGRYLLDGKHPHFKPDDYDEIIVQDTDAFNSPSWLFSDRVGFRYFPTQEIVKRFGLVGYYQLSATAHHILPGQFLKRLVKSEEERNQADEYEKQSGTFAYILSGLLPCVYWTLHYVFQCRGDGGGVKYTFAAYLFGAVYLLLAVRFALAHTMVCKSSTTSLVFRGGPR